MKRKEGSVVSATILADGVQFDVAGQGVLKVEYARLHPDVKAYAIGHGIKQRGVDAAALSRDTTNGKSASAAEKYEALKRVVDHLNSGAASWTLAAGEGGGRSLTVEAIARVKGYSYDDAEKMVEAFAAKSYGGDTKKALAFLRTGARVMEAMDAIRKERTPKPAVDADAALGELTA